MAIRSFAVHAAVIAGLASVLISPTVATAASSASTTPDGPQNCAANLSTHKVDCFDTQAQVDRFIASSHSFKNAGGAAKSVGMQSAALGNVSVGSGDLVGRGWQNFNYSGPSISFYSNALCVASQVAYFDWLPSGWNDQISSFKTYNNCGAWVYTNNNQGGSSAWIWGGNSAFSGGFNDNVSSVQFQGDPYLGS